MILLLDEQLDSPEMVVARALGIIGESYDVEVRSLRTESPGLKDPQIAPYCKQEGIHALVSANLRDFGAKLALYEALLTAGISVVVLRPQGKKSLSVEAQVSLLSKHIRTITENLARAYPECVLLRCNESGCVKRTLEDLRNEISGEGKLP